MSDQYGKGRSAAMDASGITQVPKAEGAEVRDCGVENAGQKEVSVW
jgi:hypothetical protein